MSTENEKLFDVTNATQRWAVRHSRPATLRARLFPCITQASRPPRLTNKQANPPKPQMLILRATTKVRSLTSDDVLRHLTVCKQARQRVSTKIRRVLDSILFSSGIGCLGGCWGRGVGGGVWGRRDQLNCPASYPLLLSNIKLNEHRASRYVWKPWAITQ